MMIRLGNFGEVIIPHDLNGRIISAKIERPITNCQLGNTYNGNATITFTISFDDKESYDIAKSVCLNRSMKLVLKHYNSVITTNKWYPLKFTPNPQGSYDITIEGLDITVSEKMPITIEGKDILLNPVTYYKMKDMINTPLEDLTLEEFNEYRTAIEM